MRVRQMRDLAAPIHVGPGDSIKLIHRAESHGYRVYETELLTETFLEERVVDRVAVVELDDGELRGLGMTQAVAGVFGRRGRA